MTTHTQPRRPEVQTPRRQGTPEPIPVAAVPTPVDPSPRVLVAHASRHGSTAGIAERIAERLRVAGLDAVAADVDDVVDVAAHDAYVVGAAAYMFHWLRPATRFVRRHRDLLASRPLWLFSSGPVGDDPVDDDGNDLLEVSRPREFDELHETLSPRGEKVFFGSWDPGAPPIGVAERMLRLVPAGRDTLPAGDWRDWPAIDAWADEIATALLGPERTAVHTDGRVPGPNAGGSR